MNGDSIKAEVELTKAEIDNEIKKIDNELKEIPEELLEDDPDREASTQMIIDALEDGVTKLEAYNGNSKISKQLVKTVCLICKILAVELDKAIPTIITEAGMYI